jgi:hypothetical protein
METRWLSLAVIGFLVLLCAGFAMLVATAFLPVEPAWLWPVSFLCIIVAAGMWLPLTLIIGAVADDVLSPDEKAEWEEAVFKRPFAIFELWWRHLR